MLTRMAKTGYGSHGSTPPAARIADRQHTGLEIGSHSVTGAGPAQCASIRLIEESVPGVTVWIVASRGPGRRWLSYPLPAGHGLASERRACLPGPCRGVAPKRC